MNSQWMYETLDTTETVTFKPIQTVVETDAALHGGLRDDTRIYYAGASALVHSADVSSNRISAEGKIHFKVLYAQGDLTQIIPMEVNAGFTQHIAFQQENNDTATGTAHVICNVEDVEAKVHNGRLMLRSIVTLKGHVGFERPLRCVTITDPSDRIQKKIVQVKTSKVTGEGEVQSTIRDELELSDLLQVKETLLANAYAMIEDVKSTGGNRVAVIGTIHLDAYHTSHMPQRPLISTQHKIPFEQEIALSENSGMIAAKSTVQDVAVVSNVQGDDQSEMVMRCEVLLHSVVRSIAQNDKELLCDAYTLYGEGMETVQQEIPWPQAYICEECAESGRMTVILPENSPRIKQPLLGFMDPVVIRKRKNGNKLQIDGVMQTTIIYMTDESEIPVSMKTMTPFTVLFNTAASPDDDVKLHISEPSLSTVTGDRVEVRYILHMLTEGEHRQQIQVLTEINPTNEVKERRGVSICFAQPGESAWDIAKYYRVPEEIIVRENNLLNNTIVPGKPLIVHSLQSKDTEKEHA